MFKVGDMVEWSSQAGSYRKAKRGVVAEVVAVGKRPNPERFWQLHKHSGCGFGRNHESYVVLVGKRPYWPRVSQLRALRVAESPTTATNSAMVPLADVLEIVNKHLPATVAAEVFAEIEKRHQ